MRVICNYAAQCGVLSHVLHQRDVDNRTPLFCAVETNNAQIIEFVCQVAQEHGLLGEVLQQKGCLNKHRVKDLHFNALMVAIVRSAYKNDISLMRVICNYAAQCGVLSHVFHQRDVDNRTPLFCAVNTDNTQIVEFICQVAQEHGLLGEVLQQRGGLNKDGVQDLQWNVLMIAIAQSTCNNDTSLMRVICNYAAQCGVLSHVFHQRDVQNKTPLLYAVGAGNPQIVEFLWQVAQEHGILNEVLQDRAIRDSQHGMTLIDMAISVYNGSLHSSDNGGECYRQKLIRVISILFEKMGQTGILKDKLRISNSSFMSPINPSVGIAIMFQDENLLRAICKSAYNQGILYDVLAFRGTLDGDMMLSWVNRFAPRLLSILLQYAEKREQLLTWCLDELGEKQVWNSLSYIKTYEARQLLYKIIARLPLRYGFLEREDDNADVGGEAYQPSAKRCKTTTSSQKSFSGQMTPCIQQSADTMGTTPLHLYIALYNKQGSIPVEDHAIQKQITHRDHVNDWTPRDLAAALSFQGNGKAIYNKIYDLVDECAICCTPLDRNIQTLDCHHSFHVSCIQQNREYSNTCPYCRQPIS